jgi:hypothetical protein
MPKTPLRPDAEAELPPPLTLDDDEVELPDDGLVPPANIDDDPESERVVYAPD